MISGDKILFLFARAKSEQMSKRKKEWKNKNLAITIAITQSLYYYDIIIMRMTGLHIFHCSCHKRSKIVKHRHELYVHTFNFKLLSAPFSAFGWRIRFYFRCISWMDRIMKQGHYLFMKLRIVMVLHILCTLFSPSAKYLLESAESRNEKAHDNI